MNSNERYKWVDTLKFLGIFAIYLGHCNEAAGKLYPFVFIYHVPLFFFVAGFFANNDTDKSIVFYFKKKAKQLLIPYMFFAAISIISFSIALNSNENQIIEMIIAYALGIRNTLISASLWFIPCIFVVSIIHFILVKILKNKAIVFIISIGLLIATQTILPSNPIEKASWFMNIDSGMYYIFYYSLGNILFNFIKKFDFNKSSKLIKTLIFFSAGITIFISFVTYSNGMLYVFEKIRIFKSIPLGINLYLILLALIIIYLNILIAFLFKDIKKLRDIGRNTLSMCGMENVIKLYLGSFISIFSIQINLSSPLSCVFYVLLCLIIVQFIVDKIFDKYFKFIKNPKW